MDCVIGIDGGGTRSTGLCVARSGQVLARADGGALNYNAATLDEFRKNLIELIKRLERQSHGARVLRYVIGTASLFDHANQEDTHRICENLLPQPKTCLLGDALVALYGATAGRPGVLVISGTGSIAVSMTPDKQFHTAGGFGPLIGGDPGSAFWIASQSILMAAEEGESDPLAKAVCEYFGVPHLHAIVETVYHQPDGCRRLAGLAGHLARGEQEARFGEIQQRAGQVLAAMAWPLIKRGGAEHVYVSGSVLQNNRVVREALAKNLQERSGRPVSALAPRLSPAAGAALLALEQTGVALIDPILETLQTDEPSSNLL